MKRLCFGSFAKILNFCKPRKTSPTQKVLIGTMLLSVDETCDLRDNDNAVSLLLSCKNDLPNGGGDTGGYVGSNRLGNVISKAQLSDKNTVAQYFKNNVVPLLDPNKAKLAVLAICDLIREDTTIDEETTVELVENRTKKNLLKQSEFNLANFLAGVFLYVVISVNNRCGEPSISEICESFVLGFTSQKDNITFTTGKNRYEKLTLGDAKGTQILSNDKIPEMYNNESIETLRIGVFSSVNITADSEKLRKVIEDLFSVLHSSFKSYNLSYHYMGFDELNYTMLDEHFYKIDICIIIVEKMPLISAWCVGIATERKIPVAIFSCDSDEIYTRVQTPLVRHFQIKNLFILDDYKLSHDFLHTMLQKIKDSYSYRDRIFYDFWFPANVSEINVIVSPETEKPQDADLRSRNYGFMDNVGDKDSILEIVKLLSKYYPNTSISIMETNDFLPSLLTGNIVVIGGPGGDEYLMADGNVVNDEGNKYCKLFSEKIHSHVTYTNDCETMVVNNCKYEASYDSNGFMISDYGYFAAMPNPFNIANRVVLLHGIHTLGVVGAAKIFSTEVQAESNYRFLRSILRTSGSIAFESFFQVDVYNGQAFCPRLETNNVFPLNRN